MLDSVCVHCDAVEIYDTEKNIKRKKIFRGKKVRRSLRRWAAGFRRVLGGTAATLWQWFIDIFGNICCIFSPIFSQCPHTGAVTVPRECTECEKDVKINRLRNVSQRFLPNVHLVDSMASTSWQRFSNILATFAVPFFRQYLQAPQVSVQETT